MPKPKILVVDDDALVRKSVVTTLKRSDYDVEEAHHGGQAKEILQNRSYDLIVTDMKMPGATGLEVIEKAKETNPFCVALVITAYGTLENALFAGQKGAVDYLEKPFGADVLEFRVQRALEQQKLLKMAHDLESENHHLRLELSQKYGFGNIIGKDDKMKSIFEIIAAAAPSKATVLLTGESGTGKEMFAKAIHYASNRRNDPFVKLNCAALPEGLLESELFGHEKGAFTGAISKKLGKFELANKGTLLLDEIGEMPMGLQAKLLRVLQEQEIDRVGGTQPVAIDVRIIATTNRNLKTEVEEKRFREDLFFRLNVIAIELPALRERKSDIPVLVQHFLQKFSEENQRKRFFSKQALEKILDYHWPGNVRELENMIERAVILSPQEEIPASMVHLTHLENQVVKNPFLGRTIAEVEKMLILETLELTENNRAKAAEILGVTARTLRNKLKEYSAQDEEQ